MAKQGTLVLGYDLGSSSVKASVMEVATGKVLASATCPSEEMPMTSHKPGWAEQDPELWWEYVIQATQELAANADLAAVEAIGIAYQMHGLVAVDQDLEVLRPSIIWCDSRAVEIGNKAFDELGEGYCLSHLLNSPGNFTASKLKWVKENEPQLYEQIYKIMLPGDFIAMKMTGKPQTTASGLSEGIFWDFKEGKLSDRLMEHYGFNPDFIPEVVDTFSVQGEVTEAAARTLGIPKGVKVAYRAGDQPNNAFSLNVLNPGEVAATAGTSGVVYGITDKPDYDPKSRVNTFVHVNHAVQGQQRYGVLLCVNGTGILNSWFRNNMTGINKMTYEQMNAVIAKAPIGADGLKILPFGNGAERMLENREISSQVHGLNFNVHQQAHMFRALQEGIVFALYYGFKVMSGMGMQIKTVKAGQANMFLSPIFREAFVNTTGATVELYNTDGSQGAARGAGVGAGIYPNFEQAFQGLTTLKVIEPQPQLQEAYKSAYEAWEEVLLGTM